MSVQTTADEKRDEAFEHINAAIASLSVIVIDRCSGWSDYREAYYSKLRQSLSDLIDIRDRFNS